MSDPMTNRDIEDVLSSIRRLVSQAPEPSATTGQTASEATAPVSPAQEMLVLTPAQRVEAPQTPGSQSEAAPLPPPADPPAPPAVQESGVSGPGMNASDRASLERTIAELEAAVSVYEEEWEPDGSEAVPLGGAEPAAEAPVPGDGAASDLTPTARDDDLAETVADGPAFADPVDGVAQPPADRTNEDGFADAVASVADNVRPFQPPAGARPHGATPGVSDFRLRAAPEQQDASPAFLPGPDRPETAEGSSDEAEAVLDEDALRDLISQIVREELKGELGERITRNVRKLVRAEIARALASRDLD
jgi:hypothetical protein